VSGDMVDVTLIHPTTREAVPGLYTFGEGSFAIDRIPPGTYIVWASYRNDGYVMDPDGIFKFGLPMVTFEQGTESIIQDRIILTDAIPIVSPTNDPTSSVPAPVATTQPSFVWTDYPQASEYILEVFNGRGDRIWGGYESDSTINHPQILRHTVQQQYNFDGSATEPLVVGGVYRWKVYADDTEDPDIQTLISSSEDLLGLFEVVADTTTP
jgi:hypothetical protein